MKYLTLILLMISYTVLSDPRYTNPKTGRRYATYQGGRIAQPTLDYLYKTAKPHYRLLEEDIWVYIKKTDRMSYSFERGKIGYAIFKVIKNIGPSDADGSSCHIIKVIEKGAPNYTVCIEDLDYTSIRKRRYKNGKMHLKQEGAFMICGTYTLRSGKKIPLAIYLRPFTKSELLHQISYNHKFVVK